MDTSEIINSIKKFGKPAYVAKKGSAVIKKWDPIKQQLNCIISDHPEKSLIDEPLSLIGGVTHHLKGEEWPAAENQPFLPILQITPHQLPIFSDLFGSKTKVITIYCPGSPIYIEEEGRWLTEIKEYSNLGLLEDLPTSKLEKLIYLIEWEKVIDYPGRYLFDVVYPKELADSIHNELAEEYAESFPTAQGTKVGGYPYCIQGEPQPWLKPERARSWDFIVQIDENDFYNIDLVDNGIMCLFQNNQTKKWFCDLQFY